MDYFESLTVANHHAAKSDGERNFISKLLRIQRYHEVVLLLNSEIRPYENLESILFHAAKTNGLTSITPLTRALRLPDRSILNPKRHSQLSDSLRVKIDHLSSAIPTKSPETAQENAVIFGGHRLRSDQLAISTSRVCPACISESGYGRSWWTLAPQAACEKHGIALIDHCPKCNSPISIARPTYGTCSCGFKLSESPHVQVSAGAQLISQLIAECFKHAPYPNKIDNLGFPTKHLCKLDLNMLLDLIAFLGSLNADQKISRMRKLRSPISLNLSLNNLERASRALTDWPDGFYSELRNARAFFPHTESLSLVAKSIDHVTQLATISMPHLELRFVAEAVGRFLESPEEWNSARKQFSLNRSVK